MNTAARKFENDIRSRRIARAECCKLLSACFYPPQVKMLLEEEITEKLGALLKTVFPDAVAPVVSAGKLLESENQVALSVAYTRLFLGPPELLAPPYASFYLDGPRGVMGPASVEILKMYAEMGLRIDDTFNEMPDHVTVVLEFLYYLLFLAATEKSTTDTDKKAQIVYTANCFMNRFVKTWIPQFCDQVIQANQHPFYNEIAQCLDVFIRYGVNGVNGAKGDNDVC